MDQTPAKAELRSAATIPGALFVMMRGTLLMLMLPVDNWDSLQQVLAGISLLLMFTKIIL